MKEPVFRWTCDVCYRSWEESAKAPDGWLVFHPPTGNDLHACASCRDVVLSKAFGIRDVKE